MEQNKVKDNSDDKSYFVITPQLVWALCKDPYEYTLWSVIKMIAGEGGECMLSTPDLADAAMMSSGKASQCRKSLIAAGLLEGECRKDLGYPQPVWHLTIPNLWADNIKWREENASLLGRIEGKREQKSLHQVKPSPDEEGTSPDEGGLSPDEEGTSPGETKKNQKGEPSLEPKSEPKEAPDGAASDVDTSWPVGDPPITEPTPTTPPQESILKQKDPILMAAEVARRTGGKASWTVAGPEGADPYLDGPLDAALRILREKRDDIDAELQTSWARQLRVIVEGPAKKGETQPPKDGTPALFLKACRLWPKAYGWKEKTKDGKRTIIPPYTNIYNGAFVNDMRTLMRQMQGGKIGASSKLVITNA